MVWIYFSDDFGEDIYNDEDEFADLKGQCCILLVAFDDRWILTMSIMIEHLEYTIKCSSHFCLCTAIYRKPVYYKDISNSSEKALSIN